VAQEKQAEKPYMERETANGKGEKKRSGDQVYTFSEKKKKGKRKT